MTENDDFYDPCPEGGEGVVDIGHGVRIKFTGRYSSPPEVVVGLIESHPRPDGAGRCVGAVTFDVPEAEGLSGARWQVISMEPLTLDPSLQCRVCGHHGHIRNGRWVPV